MKAFHLKGYLILSFIVLGSLTCKNDVCNELQNMWREMDDIECPDFIFFHKSGRYIVFNECKSDHPWILPIIEKGNWEIKNNKKIVLKKDEFLSKENIKSTDSNNQSSIIEVKEFFKHYKKADFIADKMKRFSGRGDDTVKLKLPPPGGATLLKLAYKLFYPGIPTQSCAIEVLIEDQKGHTLWNKTLNLTHNKEVEEILLADIPEAIDLTHLVFKVKSKVSWILQAKVYT